EPQNLPLCWWLHLPSLREFPDMQTLLGFREKEAAVTAEYGLLSGKLLKFLVGDRVPEEHAPGFALLSDGEFSRSGTKAEHSDKFGRPGQPFARRPLPYQDCHWLLSPRVLLLGHSDVGQQPAIGTQHPATPEWQESLPGKTASRLRAGLDGLWP